MKFLISLCFLLSLLLVTTVFSASIVIINDYWQCTSRDNNDFKWFSKSPYRKVALNIALDACKKQSTVPVSCKTSNATCEKFVRGMDVSPQWRCTALDYAAVAWQSNFYSQRLDAAFGAKAFCRSKSTVPETCYVNLVTCRNINGGV